MTLVRQGTLGISSPFDGRCIRLILSLERCKALPTTKVQGMKGDLAHFAGQQLMMNSHPGLVVAEFSKCACSDALFITNEAGR